MKQISQKVLGVISSNKDVVVFLLLMVIFRSSFADINHVPTGSMQPTIVEGDRILVNKLAYDIQLPLLNTKVYTVANPKRGEIVIFNSKVSNLRLVKRVIGVPGDRISMLNNSLTINGKTLEYEQPRGNSTGLTKHSHSLNLAFTELQENLLGVNHSVRINHLGSRLDTFASITIPDQHYLVLGDNRDNSADSRVIGLVPRQEIIGRSEHIFMSLNPGNYYIPRSDRFFKKL